jgi:copper resistance protein B
MPGMSADPHAGHPAPAKPADPRAGHDMAPMSGMPGMPPAKPAAPDAHAGHDVAQSSAAPATDQTPPPPIPTDHDADRYYPPAAVDQARETLSHEHGDIRWPKLMFEKLEVRPGSGVARYAWEGRASVGGDVDRLLLKSRGDGGETLERAELDVLWSHALSPWFDLQTGLRQDFERGHQTYATVGVEGLTPYEFDVAAAAFVSERGDFAARLEVAHDYRLTQRLILEPRAEANFASRDRPKDRVGSGLYSLELGLRLRYAITQGFAPYVGVNWDRRVGAAARFARAASEDASGARLVVGIRSWF